MEPSPLARKAAFALIVVVFVALGAYLLDPIAHTAGRPISRHVPSPPDSRSGSPAPSRAAPVKQHGPDIYNWLPFTQAGLAAAAAVVVRFGDAYGTFSYTETAADYAASLQPVTTPQLVSQIQAAFSTAGVATARTSDRQVSAGSAVIESIRAFGTSSLTFIVQETERLIQLASRSQPTTSYAVTVTETGASWQVSDVELASAGNS